MLMMLVAMFPQTALMVSAEEQVVSAESKGTGTETAGASDSEQTASTAMVTIVAQAEGAFLAAPQKALVSSDLAESYGYTDSVKDGVSALDVLVKAHEIIFGEDFTKDSKDNYLEMSANTVKTIFKTETYANGFLVNEGYPNDGTASGWGGYNGTTVTTQKVENGDKLDFFIYQDTTYWSDNYSWIDGNLTIKPGGQLNLTVSGVYVMNGYKYRTPKAFKKSAEPIEDVSLGWIDENGTVSVIEDTITDENGEVNITAPNEKGVYYITACGSNDSENPIIMNPTAVTVTDDITPVEPQEIPVTGISLDEELNMIKGASKQLSYQITPQNASNDKVNWTSSNDSVATVDDNGTVKAISLGRAIVTAVTEDGNFKEQCVVTVKEGFSAADLIHGIAAKYAVNGIASDANAPWFAADMAAYKALYQDSESVLSDKQIQEFLSIIIPLAEKTEKPGDLAKYIIALRALGYNPEKVTTFDLKEVNLVDKLKTLIDKKDSNVTSIYTLPYVIIAMQQGEYLSDEQLNYLINTAIENKALWQSTEWGFDGASPMLLALAPYYSTNNDVKTAVDEVVDKVKTELKKSGSVGNAASTGLVIAGLSALGIDSNAIEIDGVNISLIDKLLTEAYDTADGFKPDTDSFATEQGFRGLIAWQLYKQGNNKRIFGFSQNPKYIAKVSVENCPVSFEIIPEGATVTIENQTQVYEGKYDLPQGEYTYTVEKSGYKPITGTITVSAEDVEKHTLKNIKLSMSSTPSSTSKKITVNVKVMSHDGSKCNNSYTYKGNSKAYSAIASGDVSLSTGQSVFEATDKLLSKENISYTEKTFGYISAINGLSEFAHGTNSGWMFLVNGKLSTVGCRDAILSKDSTVVWFYTDDYTRDYGSSHWSSGGSGTSDSNTKTADNVDKLIGEIGTVTSDSKEAVEKAREAYDKLTDDQKKLVKNYQALLDAEKALELVDGAGTTFKDVKNHWAYDSIKAMYDKKIMNGISEDEFAPDMNLSRAMLTTILYRYDMLMNNSKETESSDVEIDFKDIKQGSYYSDAVAWAVKNNIVSGYNDTTFAPDDMVTREQIALMLYRYEKKNGGGFEGAWMMNLDYNDKDQISEYAYEALCWCTMNHIINGKGDKTLDPKGKATRAEAATVITRLEEIANK